MVKVQALSRNEEDFTRERKTDPVKVFRNFDPKLHPFQKAREYTRALNAVKWDKVFAKPFLFALDSHRDAVCSMTRLPNSLIYHFSGACDGELKLWNLSSRANVWSAQAHSRFVRGICPDQTGDHVFTCSDDSTVKLWKVDASDFLAAGKPVAPMATFLGENAFSGISHSRTESQFATSGVRVDIWDSTRSQPLHSFAWGADSIYTVKYSPVHPFSLSFFSSLPSSLPFAMSYTGGIELAGKQLFRLQHRAVRRTEPHPSQESGDEHDHQRHLLEPHGGL